MNNPLLSYFSLSAMPFDKEIPTRDLVALPALNAPLESLRLLVDMRGFGLITGKSGTGKSCLLRTLLAELNNNLYRPLYVSHTSIGVAEFYSHVCVTLGLPPTGRRATMLRAIKDRILTLHRQSGVHPVLIIDEAHMLPNEVLCDLRLLTNFEIDSVNALTVILCGQENLQQKLSLTALESLANSITIAIELKGLPKEETYTYVEERMKLCGGNPGLFTKNALALIHQASHGVCRSIGLIATGALHKAMRANSPQVESDHVQSVLNR